MPSNEVNKADGSKGDVVEASRIARLREGGHARGGGERRGPPYLDTGHCCQHYNQETRTP